MYSPNGKRARRGILITAVLGVVAILALSGLALGHGRHGDDHRHGGPDTGTIASFDSTTGVLAIQLTGGDTVTGLVTRQTKIKCEDEHSSDSRVRGREAEPGDDRGGHGNEPGDDNGGDNNSGSGSGSGPSGHDDNGTGANCTTADLIAGASVHEAELDLRNGKALFHEVELAE